jgi:polyribonucleotide 5'-hydroxyl-kinase
VLTITQLLSGTAEIFGTELAVNQTYTFTGHKAAVYTWHGCKLEVFGDCQTDYTAEETPMASYANLHFALEDIRMNASGNPTGGPRVMIVGPDNAGKTSLVKLLTGYATRSGRTPIVANLDPKEGMLTVPGAISAVTMESIMDVEEGWGTSPINGPSQIPVKLPLVYYYGHEDLESHRDLSKALIRRMALSVISRMEDDENVKQTGCIIDSPGSISHGRGGYEIVQHVVSEFSGTYIFIRLQPHVLI